VPVLSRRGILAIAAVVDIALQKDGRPVTAKALAARHGLPSRYLELLLQRLVRDDILKGFRGQRGGYRLVSEQSGVTANDILRTATKHATEEETNSDLVTKVVIPICPRPNMNLDKRSAALHWTRSSSSQSSTASAQSAGKVSLRRCCEIHDQKSSRRTQTTSNDCERALS
jgi:Rrf2 family protein